MLIYCQTRREVLNQISSWMADLEEEDQIEIQVQRDPEIDKMFLLNIFEKKKENIE